jgi:hypothetical protein
MTVYTIADVNQATGIHVSTVQRWLNDGGYQYTQVGSAKVFDEATFKALCERGRERKGKRDNITIQRRAKATSPEIKARRETAQQRAAKAARGNPLVERVMQIVAAAQERAG